tara:strand:- start:432 stop:638 length:207 start_codon:yes stop_codon:yes gene_type:complete
VIGAKIDIKLNIFTDSILVNNSGDCLDTNSFMNLNNPYLNMILKIKARIMIAIIDNIGFKITLLSITC